MPIAGTKHRNYLEDNIKALQVQLSKEEMAKIDQVSPLGIAKGMRYPEAAMKAVNR